MRILCKAMACLFLPLAASAAAATGGSFAADGLLFTQHADSKAIVHELPVKVHHAFGSVNGQTLFTVQDVEPTSHSDVLDGEINLWTVVNGTAVPLTSAERVLGAFWSDSLERIVYWNDQKEVILVDRAGDSRQVLLENAISPAISPDGHLMAYVSTPADWSWDSHSKAFEIRLRDLTTGDERMLLDATDAHSLIWAPDSHSLLFQSGITGVTSLWRVSTAGNDAEQLTNLGLRTAKSSSFVMNPSRASDATWSEDGRKLLYGTTYSQEGEIMVLEMDATYKVDRALHLTYGKSPSWLDNDTVLVPRPGASTDSKAAATEMRLSQFPVDAAYAESVVEISALQPFEKASPPATPQPLPTKAISKYRYPLHSSAGHPYTAFYDNNNGSGLLDWQCGTSTYNQHRGTDIGVNGWWVYAGAYGTLNSWNDGCPTTGYYGSSCGGGFGNYIKLSHGYTSGRNWYTISAHFRNGTVVASAHNCGSRVGISGSSGNSTGPHLHFEVNAYGHPYDDPFSGSCSGSVSYWCNQNGGYPTSSCC